VSFSGFSGVEFDFSPGAQVPLTGSDGETHATQALSSAAYRDGPMQALVDTDTGVKVKKGRFSLFEPNMGEAFSRAVEVRLLGGSRKETVQSFGMDPQTVVEHCLAASVIRKQRDSRLTAVMAVCGLLFLPGTLAWLAAFQLRKTVGKRDGKYDKTLGNVVLAVVVGLAVLLLWRPPFTGFWALYTRVVLLFPVAGWYLAKRICEKTAVDLRARWSAALSDPTLGAKIPQAVPRNPNDKRAEQLRKSLIALAEEQNSNVVFYAGPKGILGMGSRWGAWHLAEELTPADGKDFNRFRAWDVAKACYDRLRDLERSQLHTKGFPKPSVRHWVVRPVGEGAGSVSRPTGPEVEGYTVKDFEIQRICNEQQFGAGDRHYLGVQFVLWDGQLIITMLTTVSVLHNTLRVEVSGFALGPVHGFFGGKPSPRTKTVNKSVRFWETRTINLPLMTTEEVVRLAVRAPFTWFPQVLDHLGGSLTLPEPFGLRHAWAEQPWKHRFMADDALRTAAPVLRAVHQATISVLKDNGVDTTMFSSRALALSGQIQNAEPGSPDNYKV
jgi:hypothetical protein